MTFLVLGAAAAVGFGLWYKHFIHDKKKAA
jgi:hypothetical protein